MIRIRLILAWMAAPTLLSAQTTPSDTSVKITFGGFVDGYYAWDFGQPPTFDRAFASGVLFTTQPARHNEFNINLAFFEAKLEGARVRGRFAIQTGTSVQSNYSGEPTNGVVSGAGLSRMIQEAFVGTKLSDNVWVDGGIFFSHMGIESWISRDNPTYTRSLVADYSPYYSSGVRATWQATPKLLAHFHVVNGWQNISENNTGKGAGIRLDYAASASAALSYYNFFSDEAGNLLRTFNGVGAKYSSGNLTLLGEADYGTQDGSGAASGSSWYGIVGIARLQVTPTVAFAGRLERYDDEDGVIIGTGVPASPFKGNGGSIGVDVAPAPRVLWRTEARGWGNDTAVFPDGTAAGPRKTSMFVVSSLALTF
jgi:hypothetical protein